MRLTPFRRGGRRHGALKMSGLLLAVGLGVSACKSDVLNLSKRDAKPSSAGQETAIKTERVRSMPLVLAMSWQAGFCENHEKKSECQSQRADRYDARHFTLHGLWPHPRSNVYCNVSKADRSRDKSGNWLDLPAVQTSVATRKDLVRVMPATRSRLDRHEWIKHGTCYSKEAETYYRDSITLMDKINNSAVQKLFAANVGKMVTATAIRAAFDQSFGRGTGNRVRVSCKRDGKRQLIVELTLGLRGVVGSNPDIGRLARKSRTISAGCPRGIVDEIGLQ